MLFCFKMFYLSTIIYFFLSWFICSPSFLAMLSISTNSSFISISFFPINTMSSAYANIFSSSLPIFIPLGTFCTHYAHTISKILPNNIHASRYYSFFHMLACVKCQLACLCLSAWNNSTFTGWIFV